MASFSTKDRHVNNPAPDWNRYRLEHKGVSYSDTSDCKRILVKARTWLKENIIKIQKDYPPDTILAPSTNPKTKSKDSSIYIGAGGNAYLHWKLSQFYSLDGDEDKSSEHMMRGLEAVHTALMLIPKNFAEGGCAFYMGASGMLILHLVFNKLMYY